MNISFRLTVILVGLAALGSAEASEALVYDPGTGDYVLTYDCGEDEGIKQTTLVPSNKVAPAVESAFESTSGGIHYKYSLLMGQATRQPLMMIALDSVLQVWGIVEPPSKALLTNPTEEEIRRYQNAVELSSPSGWRAFHTTKNSGAARLGWMRRRNASPFAAGQRKQAFNSRAGTCLEY